MNETIQQTLKQIEVCNDFLKRTFGRDELYGPRLRFHRERTRLMQILTENGIDFTINRDGVIEIKSRLNAD